MACRTRSQTQPSVHVKTRDNSDMGGKRLSLEGSSQRVVVSCLSTAVPTYPEARLTSPVLRGRFVLRKWRSLLSQASNLEGLWEALAKRSSNSLNSKGQEFGFQGSLGGFHGGAGRRRHAMVILLSMVLSQQVPCRPSAWVAQWPMS